MSPCTATYTEASSLEMNNNTPNPRPKSQGALEIRGQKLRGLLGATRNKIAKRPSEVPFPEKVYGEPTNHSLYIEPSSAVSTIQSPQIISCHYMEKGKNRVLAKITGKLCSLRAYVENWIWLSWGREAAVESQTQNPRWGRLTTRSFAQMKLYIPNAVQNVPQCKC